MKELPACEADYRKFASKDAVLVAISVDSKPTNVAFANAVGIRSYPILSDFHPKGEVGRKYGVYAEDKGIDVRATIVIGKDGKVRWTKVNDLAVQRDNGEILNACGAGAKA